jgi:hypothetical protein
MTVHTQPSFGWIGLRTSPALCEQNPKSIMDAAAKVMETTSFAFDLS